VSVITRYLSSLFLRHFCLCLAGFLSLYLVVDLIEKISDFLGRDVPVRIIVAYFAAQIPNVMIFVIPVGALSALLITLAILARNSEIVALKGSGVSLWRLSQPFLAAGILLSLAVFCLENFVTPHTSIAANEIWEGLVRNRRPENASVTVEDVWTRETRLLEHLGSYDERTGEASQVTLLLFDENLNLSERIEAAGAIFGPDGVLLRDASIKRYRGLSGETAKSFDFQRAKTHFLPDFPPPPPGLGRQGETPSEELSVGALQENIRLLRAEGFYPLRQMVDLHFKFSRAFISFTMLVVGLSIGLWREKGGSVAMGLVPGLALSFLYLVSLELSRAVGYAGLLPPLLAAWLPNAFFLLLGVYLLSYVRQ
jgi:lipopolysaccharide export system permease protein